MTVRPYDSHPFDPSQDVDSYGRARCRVCGARDWIRRSQAGPHARWRAHEEVEFALAAIRRKREGTTP